MFRNKWIIWLNDNFNMLRNVEHSGKCVSIWEVFGIVVMPFCFIAIGLIKGCS